VKLIVNGEPEEWADGLTLAQLVANRMRSDKGVAAAVDGVVVLRSAWTHYALHDGQAVELLTAVQGG
jgi:thiamine biosynthesis protein ThiS